MWVFLMWFEAIGWISCFTKKTYMNYRYAFQGLEHKLENPRKENKCLIRMYDYFSFSDEPLWCHKENYLKCNIINHNKSLHTHHDILTFLFLFILSFSFILFFHFYLLCFTSVLINPAIHFYQDFSKAFFPEMTNFHFLEDKLKIEFCMKQILWNSIK